MDPATIMQTVGATIVYSVYRFLVISKPRSQEQRDVSGAQLLSEQPEIQDGAPAHCCEVSAKK